MNRFVVDANVALDWVIPSSEGEKYSVQFFDLVIKDAPELFVPMHFDVEVARVMRKTHKRKPDEFSKKWYEDGLKAVDQVGFITIGQGINLELLGQLAEAYSLDVVDVPYIHLARTFDVPLVTRDKGLISACKHWNITHWQPQ